MYSCFALVILNVPVRGRSAADSESVKMFFLLSKGQNKKAELDERKDGEQTRGRSNIGQRPNVQFCLNINYQ